MKKSTIILCGIIILAILVVSISFMIKTIKNPEVTKEDLDLIDDSRVVDNVEEKEKNDFNDGLTDFSEVDKMDGEVVTGKSDGRLLSLENAKEIESVSRQYVSNFEFTEAEQYMTNRLSDLNVLDSDAFEGIKKYYYDLPFLCQLPELKEYEDTETMLNLIEGLKDEENYLIASLFLERPDRLTLFKTPESLNPVFYGTIDVKGVEEVDRSDSIYKEVDFFYKDKAPFKVTKISFEIEKNPLKAYIVNANNKLDLYKIMDEDGYESVYYTIDEWNKISGEDGF